MNDLLYNTTDVTVAFGIVEGSQLGGTLTVSGVGLEDSTRLPLSTDNASHLDKLNFRMAHMKMDVKGCTRNEVEKRIQR